MIVYCATSNSGKLREFRRAASGLFVIEPLPGLQQIPPIEETGATFEQNATQKALYYGGHTSEYLFVDDSGLEVDALGGRPGVLSARYVGPNSNDAANNRKLLEELGGRDNRSARFVCVIALAQAGRLVQTFRETVEGEIAREPAGSNGFGYDPLFYYPPFGCTFGEAAPERKQEGSHRGKALRQLLAYLQRLSGE